MIPHHRKAFATAALLLAAGWGVAFAGHALAEWTNRTPEKFLSSVEAVDFTRLSGDARIRAIDKVARDLRGLPADERRQSWVASPWSNWFQTMTAQEKNHFAEALAPEGLDRLMAAFDQLPEERRRLLVGNSVRRLSDIRGKLNLGDSPAASGLESWQMPADLQQKLVGEGIKPHFTETTGEARVDFELFLEELQQMLGSPEALRGRPFRQ
jgi:hypothetical protein